MKQLIARLALTGLLGLFLSACGGGSSRSSIDTDDSQAIATATLGNPALGLGILPSGQLLTASNVVPGGPTTIPIGDLEDAYEKAFCQLDSDRGITLQSPKCQSNIAYVAAQAGTNYFDLARQPILNNPLRVTGVSFESLVYSTTVPLPGGNRTFSVSGGLAMPLGINKSQIKGVVVYFHGTQFDNQSVGSNLAPGSETLLVVSVFASQGYIVVLPDYIGQGVDYKSVHPYVLYPKATAQTAVDMLTAVKPRIQNHYATTDADRLKLFSTGYSEGGAYSLWFYVYINDNPSVLNGFYALTHSVGVEGAYSTSEVTKGFLFDNVGKSNGNTYQIQTQATTNMVKPLLYADALVSFATYSLNSDFGKVINPDFYAMTCGDSIASDQSKCEFDVSGAMTKLNLAQALRFESVVPATQVLNSAYGKTTGTYTYPRELSMSTSTDNSVIALSAAIDLPNDLALNQTLKDADVDLTHVPGRAVSIVSLNEDSIVSPNNFDLLLRRYPDKIRSAIKVDQNNLWVVSPVSPKTRALYAHPDHMSAPTYEFLYVLNIFNQL